MKVGGQRHIPAALPPTKETHYTLYRTLGGPQVRSKWVWKISSSPGFDSRTVQPISNRYTLPNQRIHYDKLITNFECFYTSSIQSRVLIMLFLHVFCTSRVLIIMLFLHVFYTITCINNIVVLRHPEDCHKKWPKHAGE